MKKLPQSHSVHRENEITKPPCTPCLCGKIKINEIQKQ